MDNTSDKKLWWVSWYSGCYEDEGCLEHPFQVWYTGQRSRPKYGLSDEHYETYKSIEDEDEANNFVDEHGKSDGTVCALLSASSEDEIWKAIAHYFPDFQSRFCDITESAELSDRFPNSENRTMLYE